MNESVASVFGFEVSDGEEETDTFDDMFVATATAAGYRGKLGLIKYREAEAARELELACALNSLTPLQLLAIFRVSGNSCESWHAACAHRECKKCSPMTQLRLQVSHSEWRLPRAELCEHRTTVGLARAIVSHEEHCPGCAESRHVTIAERLQASSAVPSLSQPTHRYSKIGWRSTVLRDRAAPQKLSSAATPRRIPHADRPFGPLISGWAPKAFPCRKQTQSCVPSAVYERRELEPHCPDSCRCVSCLQFRNEAG